MTDELTCKTICFFSALYWPSIGGVEAYTENLAHALTQQGNRVIVVTSSVDGTPAKEVQENGVEVVRLPSFSLLGGRLPVPKKNKTYRYMMADLIKAQIDYVAINTRFYPHSKEGLWLAEKLGIRPILIEHGSAHLTLGNCVADQAIGIYEHRVTESIKRRDVTFFGVSQASCRWLAHFNIRAEGALNNAIDAERFCQISSERSFRKEAHVSDDAFVVSSIGRLVPEKGIPQILECARAMQNEVHFFLAGKGPLKKAIEEAHLPNVHFFGRLQRPDVAALLQCSDVFCLPSRSEGFATALLECAACKTPPITTKVGGVEELIPTDDYGIVIESTKARSIEGAIRTLMTNRIMCNNMGEQLHNRVIDSFTWDATAKRFMEYCIGLNSGD